MPTCAAAGVESRHVRAPRTRHPGARLPRGTRSAGALPDRGRPGQVRGRHLVPAGARQDARHRRRVRLRQVASPRWRIWACTSAADEAAHADQRRDLAGRRGTGLRAEPEQVRQLRGQQDGDDLPGPAVGDAPVLHGRRADHRGLPGAQQGQQGGRPQARDRDAGPGGHPAAEHPRRRLPAPVLRRYAPARDDRHGAGLQPASC